MPDHTPGYTTALATQLRDRHPDLVSAEADLAIHRRRLATITRFLHNPAVALDIRQGLARDLHLPEPTR
jgi:hypothetical protein